MRKLMFVTALAASVAAFADLIDAINFEGYDAEVLLDGNGIITEMDDGRNEVGTRFVYKGVDEPLKVKAYGPDTLAKPETRTAAFTNNKENEKYLELSTGNGTLWRSINTASSGDFGTPHTIDENGIYLDTLVQFTAWEDGAPDVGADDKLAIWLSVTNISGVVETNLMVRAMVRGIGELTPTTFKLNANVDAGKWYRLTVKAFSDITDGQDIPGFQIFLDGSLLNSYPTLTFTEAFLKELDGDAHYNDIVAGKYFASLKTGTATLQAVGFQGTGAVDDIVWTTSNPIASIDTLPTYLEGADATITGKYDTWTTQDGNGADSESAYERQFLLNVAKATEVAANALEITKIEEDKKNGGWNITVGCSIDGVGLTGEAGSTIVCNGYLAVSYAAKLTGTWTTENIPVTAVDAEKGTVTVNVNKTGAKFMKVKLSTTPAPAAGE